MWCANSALLINKLLIPYPYALPWWRKKVQRMLVAIVFIPYAQNDPKNPTHSTEPATRGSRIVRDVLAERLRMRQLQWVVKREIAREPKDARRTPGYLLVRTPAGDVPCRPRSGGCVACSAHYKSAKQVLDESDDPFVLYDSKRTVASFVSELRACYSVSVIIWLKTALNDEI